MSADPDPHLLPASALATDEAPSFDLGAPPAPTAPYRVLARKYRPTTFDDLIGQQAMVRTLGNAFELGRIHQAYILTGVRGVGKTTTARILARAFNYAVPGGADRPTIHMPVHGVHCQAIIESRHMDVIEMDAASHTGIDDVRELIESARYRPVSARTKVYIIDEVHMLSKQAFNGLLKTLEEPPEHVKFLFATTEIDKVPVTVRSRCLRFDLRRVEAQVLVRHLAGICAREGVGVEDAALALIARAAEGSVRDALSLLDQAIAHGAERPGGGIDAASVRTMLGLADRARVLDLFEAVMRGDIKTALAILKDQHDHGADPAQVLTELAETIHFVTRLKLSAESAKDPSISEEERERGQAFAAALPIRVLTRAWQILLKGLNDLKDTPRPLASADMVLVRLAYAADLPTPDEALRALGHGGAPAIAAPAIAPAPQAPPPRAMAAIPAPVAPRRIDLAPAVSNAQGSSAQGSSAQGSSPQGSSAQGSNAQGTARAAPAQGAIASARVVAPAPAPAVAPAPPVRATSLAAVVALAETRRDIQLKQALERDVRLVRFEEGRIEFALAPGGAPQLAATLSRRLEEWTGRRWIVALSSSAGAPTLREAAAARESEAQAGVSADPLVRSALQQFPGAEIVAVRTVGAVAPLPETLLETLPETSPPPGALDEDVGYTDDLITEDDL